MIKMVAIGIVLSAGTAGVDSAANVKLAKFDLTLRALLSKTNACRLQLRGGRSGVFVVNETNAINYDEVRFLAEEMRRRIPSDYEVRHSSGLPVAADNLEAESNLRHDLDSFNVHAFGVSDLKGDHSENDLEDKLGPLILLKSFWETEVETVEEPFSLIGNDDMLHNPLRKKLGNSSWNDLALELNSEALQDAARWPSKSGADRVRCLPSVRGLEGNTNGLDVATSSCFHTTRFRALMRNLLEMVVDGGVAGAIHPGMIQVVVFLYLLLPLTTTARIISVLQRSEKYLLDYWNDNKSLVEITEGKSASDAEEWRKLVEQSNPVLAHKVSSSGVSLEVIAQEWFSSLFFGILNFQNRSTKSRAS